MGVIASVHCRSIRRRAFHRIAFRVTALLIGSAVWAAVAAPQQVLAQSGVHLEESGQQGEVPTPLAALIEEARVSEPVRVRPHSRLPR
jgi:hypothetical protein